MTSELRTSGLDGCREQAKGEVAAHVTVQRVSPLAPSRVTGHSPGCLARACSPRSHTPFSWPPRQTAPHLMYDPPALNPWTSSPYTLTASVTSSSLCLYKPTDMPMFFKLPPPVLLPSDSTYMAHSFSDPGDPAVAKG